MAERKNAMKLFRKKSRTVEENFQRYENLLRQGTDDLIFPLNRFYKECRGEEGEEDGELVIMRLEQEGYTVRVVERYSFLGNSMYIMISR